MKIQKSVMWMCTLLVIISLAACATQPIATIAVSDTQTAETVIPTNTAIIPTMTATPEPTVTPSPTATIEPTSSEVVTEPAATAALATDVFLTLAENTVCRTGPATVYQSVDTIPAGLRVHAVGRLNNENIYFFIENPNNPETHCWVFGQGATVEGNSGSLLYIALLPSPTPFTDADFTVTYSNIKQCGDDYSFSFRVNNTHSTVWQSIRVHIVDVKTKVTADYASNRFEESLDCHLDNYQGDLAKGERAFITPYNPGHFDYRPWGGTFLLRVTLCTEKDYSGTCLTREITVKP